MIKLGRLLNCSIDFLLNNDLYEQESKQNPYALKCDNFIRECGYFFLATSVQNIPKLRPMEFLYPMIQQEFAQENEIYSVIFRIQVEHARID